MAASSGFLSSPGHAALGNVLGTAPADRHGHQNGQCRRNMLGAALENFPAQKQKKSFGSTYARKKEAKKTSRRTKVATPKIGNFHF
jgi:hypothetical protein